MNHNLIKQKILKNVYDLSVHAHQERQDEEIRIGEIEETILKSGIIEQYPEDPRGKSCLIAGIINNKPLHVICGFRGNRLLIVTVYRPKLPIWKDYKTRTKELKSRV